MKHKKELLAFVHIEKAAGSTLNALLEENFTFKCCRVVPLRNRFPVVFDAQDMRIIQRINPFVEVISGHPVRPFCDLGLTRTVNYITLLREPVARYLSHYQHWVEKRNYDLSFEEFLEKKNVRNFQTKKMAGSDDLEAAKKYLDNFFLVGTVENFDDFLKVLQVKMLPREFIIHYEKKNIGSKKTVGKVLSDIEKYQDEIINNNKLDIELYKYALSIFEKEKNKLSYEGNGNELKLKNNKKILLRLYKKMYYEPLIYLVRSYFSRKESKTLPSKLF